jgi:hypothetical protein
MESIKATERALTDLSQRVKDSHVGSKYYKAAVNTVSRSNSLNPVQCKIEDLRRRASSSSLICFKCGDQVEFCKRSGPVRSKTNSDGLQVRTVHGSQFITVHTRRV